MQEYTVIKKGLSIQPCINMPDAIITATAKTANLHLVTRNTEDFKKVEVQISNSFD